MMHEKQMLLKAIQKYDFALYDLNLYLDTHPHSKEALQLFQKYKMMKQNTEDRYIKKYGPLTAQQSASNTPWNCVEGPWPWERSAN